MARLEQSTGPGRTAAARTEGRKVEQQLDSFHSQLRERGLKSTGQRDDIARVFFELGRHISAEELYAEVKKINPHVGYATIYRTLRLLKECELVNERHFADGQARYEMAGKHHHDHFICDNCGRIIEFENEGIERLQREVARALDVEMSHHRLELYGLCADCRRNARH
ncbi:MAG: Fur family transcriptional regulator [Candidatus Binataceae bacterium]